MSHVAREMQRQGFTMPLLIGGATTSRAHTALKIDPHYKSPTVWVKDASRAVGVAQSLISPDLRGPFVAANDADYADIRQRPPQPRRRQAPGPLEKARGQRSMATGPTTPPAPPNSPACTCVRRLPAGRPGRGHRLDAVLPGLGTGRQVPGDPDDAVVGAQASELYRDARAMLDTIIAKLAHREGRVRLWPANSVGDDVEVVDDDGTPTTLHFLRQQVDKPVERPDFCLADFIAPKDSGKQDWIGAFAVTAGIGIERTWRASRPTTTTTTRSCSRRWPTAWPKPSPKRLHQRVRTRVLGLCRRRVAGQRGADRREVPRHPPRPRLSGLPRAQRESARCSPARCGPMPACS
jgi:5-methyltetrahydrofolate--homocysteine methyltransferase